MKKMRLQVIAITGMAVLVSVLAGCEPTGGARQLSPKDETGSVLPNELGLSPAMKRLWSLPLNNPAFVSAEEASQYMEPKDLVAGVVVAGQARAYPWWLVNAHHVVNDTVQTTEDKVKKLLPGMHKAFERQRKAAIDADKANRSSDPLKSGNKGYKGWSRPFVPILITVCEACKGTAAFVPVVDGEMPTSGPHIDSAGIELDNDMSGRPLVFAQCRSRGSPAGNYNAIGVYTICDMQTHSRWHPFSGQAKSGPLEGRKLIKIPAFSDYWENWVRDHPDTVVAFSSKAHMKGNPHLRLHMPLHDDTHRAHSTFHQWLARDQGQEDTRLPRYELVLGMATENGKALAYRLSDLHELGGVSQVEFDGGKYLFVLRNAATGIVYHRRMGEQDLNFSVRSRNPFLLQDQFAGLWTYLGDAVTGKYEGRSLQVVQDSYVAKWFEWAANHPETTIATVDETKQMKYGVPDQ